MRALWSDRRDRAETLVVILLQVLGRLSLAVLVAFLAMYLFVRIALEVQAGSTHAFDVAAVEFFQTHRDPLLYRVMRAISWLGEWRPQTALILAALGGMALVRRLWPDGLALVLSSAGGLLLVLTLKVLFGRPRPAEMFAHLGYAFPSGHSFLAVAVYGVLAYWVAVDAPRWAARLAWTVAVIMMLLMGFSRVYVGEHYPSDVAGGFALAVPWLWGCLSIPAAFHRRGHRMTLEERKTLYRTGRERLLSARDEKPALLALSVALARDRRVPILRRVALVLSANYMAMPFDLIPDSWAGVGSIDDLALAATVLAWTLPRLSPELQREHWSGDADLGELVERMCQGVREIFGRS